MNELELLQKQYEDCKDKGRKIALEFPNDIQEDTVEGLESFIHHTTKMVDIAKELLDTKRKIVACQTK